MANSTKSHSIRVRISDLERFRRLAESEGQTLNAWLVSACRARAAQAESAMAALAASPTSSEAGELPIDWSAMAALAKGLDCWCPPTEHSIRDALLWLCRLAAPLAAGDLQVTNRAARQAIETLTGLGQEFGQYLDGHFPDGQPHSGLDEIFALVRGLIAGELAIAGRELVDHLRRFEKDVSSGRVVVFDNGSPDKPVRPVGAAGWPKPEITTPPMES